MKKSSAASANLASVATISIDLASLLSAGTIVVQAPPPALVTPKNASHLGLTPRQVADALRAMRKDERFKDAVIASGKIRAAAPEAIIEYLRSTSAKASTEPAPPATTVDRKALLAKWASAASDDKPGDATLREVLSLQADAPGRGGKARRR